MAETSEISWTDATFNPWVGCTKIAQGCKNCYAEADFDKRKHFAMWGPNGTRVLTSAAYWKKPLAWNRQAEQSGTRLRVFCASLADVFEAWGNGVVTTRDGDVWCKPYLEREWGRENWETCDLETMQHDPQGWQFVTLDDVRRQLFALIDATPHLDWLLLTKRPENICRMWRGDGTGKEPGASDYLLRDNVWLGTSVATQADADKNVPELLKCRDLSPVLFLSIEPLLGPIDLRMWNPANPKSEGEWMASVEGVCVI